MHKNKISMMVAVATFVFTACSKDGDVNFFSKKQDVAFGKQLDSLVNADYNVVPRNQAAEAYAYLEGMRDAILQSEEILYREDFEWKVTIINEDVLNAFAAPGGYLYFYTGIMKYLSNGAELSGVMAHEIAHADKRHSTEAMTKAYGVSILLSILVGENSSKLAEIAAQLAQGSAQLAFSRNHEYESDEFAVKYNMDTKYDPRGVAGFFIKLEEEGGERPPEFLSTHPNPDNRVEKIDELLETLGNPTGGQYPEEYQAFLLTLP